MKVSAGGGGGGGNLWFLSLRFTTGDILGLLLLISDIFGGGRNTFRGGFLLLFTHFSRLKRIKMQKKIYLKIEKTFYEMLLYNYDYDYLI